MACATEKEDNGHFRIPEASELSWPFGDLDVSDEYLKESAYEILITCCRTSYACRHDTLPYITSPRSEKAPTSPVAKIRRALGLKTTKKANGSMSASPSYSSSSKSRKGPCISEVVRDQLGISEQSDTRLRQGLLRIFTGQGKCADTVVLPFELLQQLKPSDFFDMCEYHAWQKRQLRILELGILVHPYVPLKHPSIAAVRFREIIQGADDKPIEMGKNSETMQELHNLVAELVCRSNNGTTPKFIHWADAFPLNLHLYLMLLGSCFDRTEQTTVIEEIDGVMDLMKKTWGVLGFNQMLHNICFTWVLFQQFVATGQIELDFLGAVESQLTEVDKDAKKAKDPLYMRVLNSTLGSILEWAEKKLLSYHDTFHASGPGFMQSVLSLALATAKVLAENVHQENKEKLDISRNRIDIYIRSSLQSAFSKKAEHVEARNTLFKGQGTPNPDLLMMAQDTWELARKEKDAFSPMLKMWHPFPLGIAAVTLHSCYGRVLKRYLSGIPTLTPEAIQVLLSAESLEKKLVQIAVKDSVDCEDGGKGVMQEMSPYEANSTLADLTKIWFKERLDRLQGCVNGSIKQEIWSPKSAQEQYASSAVEVLTIIKESLDAFSKFSIPYQLDSPLYLVSGLERSLQCYISNAKSGCGSKNSYLPSFPSLTRCKKETKFFGLWKRKRRTPVFQKSKGSRRSKCLKTPIFRRSRSLGGPASCFQSSTGATFGLEQLFVRINTLYYIQSELNLLDQVISHGPKITTQMKLA